MKKDYNMTAIQTLEPVKVANQFSALIGELLSEEQIKCAICYNRSFTFGRDQEHDGTALYHDANTVMAFAFAKALGREPLTDDDAELMNKAFTIVQHSNYNQIPYSFRILGVEPKQDVALCVPSLGKGVMPAAEIIVAEYNGMWAEGSNLNACTWGGGYACHYPNYPTRDAAIDAGIANLRRRLKHYIKFEDRDAIAIAAQLDKFEASRNQLSLF